MIPNPPPTMPPGFNGVIDIIGWVKWGAFILCLIAIIVTAALMWRDKRGNSDYLESFGKILVAIIIISGSTAFVTYLASP